MVYFTLAVMLIGLALAVAALVWMGQERADKARLSKGALLVLLALGLSYWGYLSWQRARWVESCAEHLRDLGAAVEAYGANYDVYPASLEDLMPFYFDDLPDCPLDTANTVVYELGYKAQGDNFTIECHGTNHSGWGGAPEGFPRYSASEGLVLR